MSYQKALDILRVVGHTDLGADRAVFSLPLPLFRSLQIGLRSHCLRVGFKVTPKATGSDPSIWPLYSVGGFPYIPSSEFVRGGSRTILVLPSFETFTELCHQIEFVPYHVFLNLKMPSSTWSQFITPSLGLRMLPHWRALGWI